MKHHEFYNLLSDGQMCVCECVCVCVCVCVCIWREKDKSFDKMYLLVNDKIYEVYMLCNKC